MKAKKRLTKIVLGLSLCAFLYPVSFSLFIILNCPTILRTSGSTKGQYFAGGVINGILFFLAIWSMYGIIRWVIIWPLCKVARCFTLQKVQHKHTDKDEQKQ